MRHSRLYTFFSEWKSKAETFRKNWSDIIDETINVHYPYWPENWENCKKASSQHAIMVVGQMPGNWWIATDSVAEDMKASRGVEGKTPFFKFISDMETAINGVTAHQMGHCYWTNVFRMATESPQINKQALVSNEVFKQGYLEALQSLSCEIEIMEPDIILFCTGPGYDKYLEKIFSSTVHHVDGYGPRHLARLSATGLPEKTFRTYHPGYLHRIKHSNSIDGHSFAGMDNTTTLLTTIRNY